MSDAEVEKPPLHGNMTLARAWKVWALLLFVQLLGAAMVGGSTMFHLGLGMGMYVFSGWYVSRSLLKRLFYSMELSGVEPEDLRQESLLTHAVSWPVSLPALLFKLRSRLPR